MNLLITYRDDARGCTRRLGKGDVTPELVAFYQGLCGSPRGKMLPLYDAQQQRPDGTYDGPRDWLLDAGGIETVDGEYTDAETVPATDVPPVQRLDVKRRGARLHATWRWPAGVTLAEVAWESPDGDRTTAQITRTMYLQRNGISQTQPNAGRLVVTNLRIQRDSEPLRSPDRTATFGAEPLQLQCTVRRSGPMFRRRHILEVTPSLPCTDLHLTARLHLHGMTVAGSVIGVVDVRDAGPGHPIAVQVTIPRRKRRSGLRVVRCEVRTGDGRWLTVDAAV